MQFYCSVLVCPDLTGLRATIIMKGVKIMIEEAVLEKVSNRIFEEKSPVLKTGFRDLDTVLSGIEKSSIITIGSRPAMGKTSFMTTVMLNLLEQGKKCLYFSLDTSNYQLVKRLLGQLAEVDYFLLNNAGAAANKQSKEKIAAALDKLSKYDITVFDEITKVENIKATIEELKPDFVFIDYLQLIEIPDKKSRTEGFEEIMACLKKTAKENDCTIFITSQLSRSLESRCEKRPLLSDLRESGAIENISDVVLFVYRDEYYNFADIENSAQNKGKAEIIVAKNKFGATVTINLLFRQSIMKFLEPIQYDYKF